MNLSPLSRLLIEAIGIGLALLVVALIVGAYQDKKDREKFAAGSAAATATPTSTGPSSAAFESAWARVDQVSPALRSSSECSAFTASNIETQVRVLSDHIRLSGLSTGGKLMTYEPFVALVDECRESPSLSVGQAIESVYDPLSD